MAKIRTTVNLFYALQSDVEIHKCLIVIKLQHIYTLALFSFPDVLPSTEGFLTQEQVHCCHGYIGAAANFAFPRQNANVQNCKRRSITFYSVPSYDVNFVQTHNHESNLIIYVSS